MTERWTNRATQRLRVELSEVEVHAADLPWAARSAWTTRARVGTERRLWIRRERDQRIVKVDLHGLDAAGARQVCEIVHQALLARAHPLRYVRVVVGRGHHSREGRRVLAGVAAEILRAEHPVAIRSSTADAADGYLDAWHRDLWPRPRLR